LIVDAHQHLWQIGRNGHEWPTPDLAAIHRDFESADLAGVLEGTGVTATVLVQSQPSDLETDWMLGIAAETGLIRGVIGWTGLAAPDAPARIRALARRPKLKGLRPMLQGLAEDDWILRPEVRPALTAMTDAGLSFDALVFTRHLPSIVTLAEAYPALTIVIDHGAKPPFARPEEMPLWRDRISLAAQCRNIACKLSGLFTELAPGQDRADALPVADHLLAAFGAERLMWGSDWPVADLAGGYHAWLDWTQSWLDNGHASAREAILYKTASALYRLD
jgi:L-fuconolactonase